MNLKTANILSIVGHPLLTIPAVVIIILFNYEDFDKAVTISALILGCVIIPLSLKMYMGSRNGTYTNFDISNKNQRQSWYLIALFLLLILLLFMFSTNQSHTIKWNVLYFFMLLLISKLLNFYIKSSLHVSLNIFLIFIIMPLNTIIGILFLTFVLFVSWSRIVLKRHTVKEVIYGSIIGLSIGLFSCATTTLL